MSEIIYEGPFKNHIQVIRQLGKYLESIGAKAFIIPKGYFPTEEQYVPYIYIYY